MAVHNVQVVLIAIFFLIVSSASDHGLVSERLCKLNQSGGQKFLKNAIIRNILHKDGNQYQS